MRASKGVLSLLWISNEFGTTRGFSAYTLSEFCGLGHRSTRELLSRLVKRGILLHDKETDLYTLKPERTILSGRDGLPYETGILQQMRKEAAEAKLTKGV
jgi:DNA-binding IclR family transcriptional regulator